MSGTPDWQKNTQISAEAVALLSSETIAPGSPYDTGWQKAASFSSVRLAVNFQSGYGDVNVFWTDDPTVITDEFSKSWGTPLQTQLLVFMPMLARYYKITVENLSSSNANVEIYITALQIAVTDFTYPRGNSGWYLAETSVPAGNAVTIVPDEIFAGPIYISIRPYDSTAKLICSLQTLTSSGGTSQTISDLGAPANITNYQFALPDTASELYIYNYDTSAHSVRAALVRA